MFLPKFLGHYNDKFENHTHPFLFGDKPATTDFLVGGTYLNYINNPNVGYAKEQWQAQAEKYPHFTAYGKRLEALLAKYLETRPPRPV